MSGSHSGRWLALAARHRLWQVEERRPELAHRAAEQEHAERAHDAAQARVAQVRGERSTLLAGAFAAPQLAHHVDFDAHVQRLADQAGQAAAHARDETDRLRAEARRLLAERDACVERLRSLQARERQATSRRETREHDELWLAPVARASGTETGEP